MIIRIWRGWTAPAQANAYEALLRTCIIPGIRGRGIAGFRGMELLRRELGEEVEFATLMWFDDMQAVRDFAGEDAEMAVVPDAARALLSRFDARSAHYELREKAPSDSGGATLHPG